MKKLFFILVAVIGFGIIANAQDVITLKNGTDINALVQRIGDVEIEYKKFDNLNGPNYTLKKTEILMIRYENGSKDIFSEEVKPIETKDNIIISDSEKQNNTENIEKVYIPENAQNRKDIIVKIGRGGFQARITHVSDKHIYFMKYKNNGGEKSKKIKQKQVSFTLSFTDKARQERYPLQMDPKDFLSLPIYFDKYNNWIVFGTNGMNSLSQLRKAHPALYQDYMKGKKQYGLGMGLYYGGLWGIIFPIALPGAIILGQGVAKIGNAFMEYYATCVDIGVCEKYGIILTPYRIPVTLKKN